jgi:hypothetical protein
MPPLSTVVGGSLFAYYADHADFTLETKEFAAQLSLGDTGSIPIPALPFNGTTINCSAILAGGQTLRFGFVDFAGHPHQKLWFEGTLHFDAEQSILVPALPATGAIHLSTGFSLSGNLIAYPSDPFVDPPPKTFEYLIRGKGTVTVRLTEASGGQRRVTSYFYQFV